VRLLAGAEALQRRLLHGVEPRGRRLGAGGAARVRLADGQRIVCLPDRRVRLADGSLVAFGDLALAVGLLA